MKIETEEEMLIYDFSAIIAGVGGSLGLFLGFSCLQAVEPTLKKIAAILKTSSNPQSRQNGFGNNSPQKRYLLNVARLP